MWFDHFLKGVVDIRLPNPKFDFYNRTGEGACDDASETHAAVPMVAVAPSALAALAAVVLTLAATPCVGCGAIAAPFVWQSVSVSFPEVAVTTAQCRAAAAVASTTVASNNFSFWP